MDITLKENNNFINGYKSDKKLIMVIKFGTSLVLLCCIPRLVGRETMLATPLGSNSGNISWNTSGICGSVSMEFKRGLLP